MARVGRVPEMIEADLIQSRGRLVAGDMAPQLGGLAVGLQHHRHRVPADERAQARFQLGVAGQVGLLLQRDRVDVGGRQVVVGVQTLAARAREQRLQQLDGAPTAFVADHVVERAQPFAPLELDVSIDRHPN